MKRTYLFIVITVLLLSGGLFAQNSSGLEVANIAVCTSVENRQPIGTDSVFSSDVGKLYCFFLREKNHQKLQCKIFF